MLNRLRNHIPHIVTLCAAGLMLFAFIALQPWGGGFSLPAGFAPPANFAPPSDTNSADSTGGFTPPAGFELPEDFGATAGGVPGGFPGGLPNPLSFLVPIAAIIALLLTLWRWLMPRFKRSASILTLVVGALTFIYYFSFFTQNSGTMPGFGFWLALVGSVGLIAQVFIPRIAVAGQPGEQPANVPVKIKPSTPTTLDIGQNIGVAFDALLTNKLRSGLTMLGIVIGVMSVVSLLSIGRGAQTAVTEQIAGTGLNLLTISPGAGGFGPGAGGGGSEGTLKLSDAEAIERELDGVEAVLVQYSESLRVSSDEEDINATVVGVVSEYAEVRNIDVDLGLFFSEAESGSRARVAVLGSDAAEELFGGLNPIGRTVRINGQRFDVVGVLEQQDSSFGSNPNLQVYVPLTTGYRNLFDARSFGSGDYEVSSITVAVENIDEADRLISNIERLLRRLHEINPGEDDDFNVLDQQQLLDAATTVTSILTVLLGAIASVSLIVGGIGIMNISLVSVTERTKEIGLRKAIGARRSHILQQFLIETMVLSTIGGVVGVLAGVGIALLVNGSGLLTATITADSILLGLGFSIAVGVFFGVYPATRAAALPPIEALRYE